MPLPSSAPAGTTRGGSISGVTAASTTLRFASSTSGRNTASGVLPSWIPMPTTATAPGTCFKTTPISSMSASAGRITSPPTERGGGLPPPLGKRAGRAAHERSVPRPGGAALPPPGPPIPARPDVLVFRLRHPSGRLWRHRPFRALLLEHRDPYAGTGGRSLRGETFGGPGGRLPYAAGHLSNPAAY